MSGPFGSSQWMYASGGFYDYEIDGSLRFNDDDNAYLSHTPAAGNRKTWTFSCWAKRSNLTRAHILTAYTNSADTTNIAFGTANNELQWYDYISGYRIQLSANAVFRDVAGWYHLVFALDTTQATASDRAKIWVNGERVTSFWEEIYPSQNADLKMNSNIEHRIGDSAQFTRELDGYLADVHFIDGTALDPTSFGETKSGVWIPKEYSGSYGTYGYHLEFAGNTNDTSGEGNNWTANNISSYDYVPDSPTNNFATFSPLGGIRNGTSFFGKGTLSEGNLLTTINSDNENSIVPFGPASGKWYVEFCAKNLAQRHTITAFGNDGFNVASTYVATRSDGGENATGDQSWTTGDIIGVAYDFDNGKVWFAKNNTWYNSSNPATNTGGDAMSALYGFSVHQVSGSTGNATTVFNAGQDSSFAGTKTAQGNTDANGIGDFYYAPPSGFLAACSANLPDPAIDPAQGESPADYFDTILYTAATSNGTYTHGSLSFQPDFSWIKNRNNVEEHYLIDVVRDNTSVTNTFLNTNSTDAEGAGGVSGTTFSVTSTGYEFVETSINSGELYFNGRTYVGWNWLAGGTAVSNTDGSITSSVSANTDAGFSVVSYTGNNTAGSTVGHGLGQKPACIIVKRRSAAMNWGVYHQSLASNEIMQLDVTNAVYTSSGVFNSTEPTASVFYLGGGTAIDNASGSTYIAYCFAEKEGYSKFGTYVGNGSSDGPFIYTGFRPAGIIAKNIDDGTTNWWFHDNERLGYNEKNYALFPNLVQAEDANVRLDILSNGFKIRNTAKHWNTSGQTFIYLAFAEQPFKYANAR